MSLVEDELYKQAENLTLFRKSIHYLRFNGTFLESFDNQNPEFLYFNKINNDACREIATGKIFYRTIDNSFYNEESGLYFYMRSFIKIPFDKFDTINNDEKHLKEAYDFIDYYVKSKKETECLMLKKN